MEFHLVYMLILAQLTLHLMASSRKRIKITLTLDLILTTSSGNLVNEPYASDHNFYSAGQIQQNTDGGNIYSFHKQIVHTAYENIEGWANNGAPSIIDPSDLYIGLTDFQAGFPILWFEQGNP